MRTLDGVIALIEETLQLIGIGRNLAVGSVFEIDCHCRYRSGEYLVSKLGGTLPTEQLCQRIDV
jgi:hypothetical protein